MKKISLFLTAILFFTVANSAIAAPVAETVPRQSYYTEGGVIATVLEIYQPDKEGTAQYPEEAKIKIERVLDKSEITLESVYNASYGEKSDEMVLAKAGDEISAYFEFTLSPTKEVRSNSNYDSPGIKAGDKIEANLIKRDTADYRGLYYVVEEYKVINKVGTCDLPPAVSKIVFSIAYGLIGIALLFFIYGVYKRMYWWKKIREFDAGHGLSRISKKELKQKFSAINQEYLQQREDLTKKMRHFDKGATAALAMALILFIVFLIYRFSVCCVIN
ncbi:MAG: hypothetical protein COY66_05225 [Candidatus Kerfeldbacteria bacterium CG_4_10_14_0_8_um_filter_42_10]|uniref:Uncharacterized protein n=1 Tax=Candidatus Kerfeldbacteria bacterium CG_4_10_14_0_8_um_filter_42_10 TaxID=2014248 RepID=A0A2M7RHN4_9BACT|nr:MAG: hypothetical protein COY66_05225 [Candidatus Kerfeldbacteria bacterium CG_4_10_14_0_8_um_filter_42_10]